MIEFLIISSVINWIFVLALTVTVLALARQIGVLHERIRPVGALGLARQLVPGQMAPAFTATSLSGGSISIGGPSPRRQSTLLFFLSPTCPVCKQLLTVLKSTQDAEGEWLRIVLASDGPESQHLDFIGQYALERFPYLLSTEIGMAYRIGRLPYAVLVDGDGNVAAHGLVNNREQLESLFEGGRRRTAQSSGHQTLASAAGAGQP